MSTQSVDEGRTPSNLVDAQITASVKGLAASLDIKAEELAAWVGIDRATYYRRRKHGGWKATEVAAIAARCRVKVEDIYAGRAVAVLGGGPGPEGGGAAVTPTDGYRQRKFWRRPVLTLVPAA